MNLVAKEYVSVVEEDRGVLILSQFTGAARELVDALQVNPYHIEEMAEAIRVAGKAEAKAIREATNDKVKTILTAEQFTKFQELTKRRGGRGGPGGPGGPGGAGGPPPPKPEHKD